MISSRMAGEIHVKCDCFGRYSLPRSQNKNPVILIRTCCQQKTCQPSSTHYKKPKHILHDLSNQFNPLQKPTTSCMKGNVWSIACTFWVLQLSISCHFGTADFHVFSDHANGGLGFFPPGIRTWFCLELPWNCGSQKSSHQKHTTWVNWNKKKKQEVPFPH